MDAHRDPPGRSGDAARADRSDEVDGWLVTLAGCYMLAALAAALGAGLAWAMRWPVGWTACAGAALGAAHVVLRRRQRLAGAPPWTGGRAPIVLAALAAVPTLVLAMLADTAPIADADEAVIWAAKAHAFWFAHDLESLRWSVRVLPVEHADYPCLVPLLQFATYGIAGEPLICLSRVPIQLAQLALVALWCGLLGELRSRRATIAAGLGLAAMCGADAFLWNCEFGHADGLVALGTLGAVCCWSRWAAGGGVGWLRAAGLASALLVAAKNEGLMLAAIAIGVGVFARWRRDRLRSGDGPWPLVWAVALPLLVAGAGRWLNGALQVDNDLLHSWQQGQLASLLDGSRHARVAGFLLFHWLGSWSARGWLLLGALAALWSRRDSDRIAAAMVLVGLLGYYLVFVATPRDLQWHLDTAGVRVFSHLLPVGACLLARAFAPMPAPPPRP